MPATLVEHRPVELAQNPTHRMRRARWWLVAGCILIGLVACDIGYLALNWPFEEQSLVNVLQEASLRTVKIGAFHKSFFRRAA